jgi:hypothetical protein
MKQITDSNLQISDDFNRKFEKRRMFLKTGAKKPFHIAPQKVRVLDYRAQVYAAYCSSCQEEVELLTFREAAQIAGTSLDAIINRAAAGKFHLSIIPAALLICLDSLVVRGSEVENYEYKFTY